MHPHQILDLDFSSLEYFLVLPRDIQRLIDNKFQYYRNLAQVAKRIVGLQPKTHLKYINIEKMTEDIFYLMMRFLSHPEEKQIEWSSSNIGPIRKLISNISKSQTDSWMAELVLNEILTISRRAVEQIAQFISKTLLFPASSINIEEIVDEIQKQLGDLILTEATRDEKTKSDLLVYVNPLTLEIVRKVLNPHQLIPYNAIEDINGKIIYHIRHLSNWLNKISSLSIEEEIIDIPLKITDEDLIQKLRRHDRSGGWSFLWTIHGITNEIKKTIDRPPNNGNIDCRHKGDLLYNSVEKILLTHCKQCISERYPSIIFLE